MKIIGIIGGLGPESTVDYYRQIIAAYREQQKDGSYPPIIINSIDLTKLRGFFEVNELGKAAEYLVDEVERLARAGAQCGLLSAVTPHIVFDDVSRQSPIPLVSIVEASCEAAKALGLKRLGLFGTRFTMQGRFYSDVFSREGMALVVPEPVEQAYVHDKYFAELVNGSFLPETRKQFLAIADRMIEREKMEGLILGGTELPLLLREATHQGIPLLDATRIHVQAIVAKALS
jgi:aspartate racemase